MSVCRSASPVTSSIMFRPVAPQLPIRWCTRNLRLSSLQTRAYHSSKRELQTATAYRPHTLPDSFPPPRNSGIPDTSIAGGIPDISSENKNKQSSGQPNLPQSDGSDLKSNVSLPEGEAQKSKPISSETTSSTTSSTSTQSSTKPRRSRLRPRKAAMSLTPLAIEHLRHLLSQPDPKMIRVGVKNRGCSGLSYHLEYVEKAGKFDEVVEQEGVKVLIDSKALFSIIGSEMDWQEDKLSSRFVFRNPNISKFSILIHFERKFSYANENFRGSMRLW